MPKTSDVWNYFTPLKDDNGKKVGKATCNKCVVENRDLENKEFNTKGGTTNMWRHLLKQHYTDPGHEKGTLHCKICQSKLEGGITSSVEHVVACNNLSAAAEGASRPPAVQTLVPPDAGSSPMDLEPADHLVAQPPLLQSIPSRPGGSSSMDPEPADLRVQPQPSAGPSRLDGEEHDMEKVKHHRCRLSSLQVQVLPPALHANKKKKKHKSARTNKAAPPEAVIVPDTTTAAAAPPVSSPERSVSSSVTESSSSIMTTEQEQGSNTTGTLVSGSDEEESFTSTEEFQIDESFWLEALSMPPLDPMEPTDDAFDGAEAMDFWLEVFMETDDDVQELPKI